MASKIGLSYRNEAALARLSAVLAELGEAGGEGARGTASRRDGALEATLRLEWMAGVLERVAARTREQGAELEARAERIRALEAGLAGAEAPSRPARKARAGG